MELTNKQKKQLFGLLALAVILPVAMVALATIVNVRSRADAKPTNVKEANKGINHFAITWKTADNVLGKIHWGTSRDRISNVADDDRTALGQNGVKKNHQVTVHTSTAGSRSTARTAASNRQCDGTQQLCVTASSDRDQYQTGQTVVFSWDVGPFPTFTRVFVTGPDGVRDEVFTYNGSRNYTFSSTGQKTFFVEAEPPSDSGVSNVSSQVTVSIVQSCSAPANLRQVSVTTNSATFDWDTASGVDGYQVERNGVNVTIPNIFPPFTDNGLTGGTTYTYRVRASCGFQNWSDYSTPIQVTTAQSCNPPLNVDAVKASANSIQVLWGAGSGQAPLSYNVERSIDGGAWQSRLASTPVLQFVDQLLSPGSYRYRVSTNCGGGGQSQPIESQTVVISPQTGNISGNVWKDDNKNGQKDPGEQGFAGIQVGVPNQFNPAPATTDAQGNYSMTNVPAGTYNICVFTPNGYQPTNPANGCRTVTVPPDQSNIDYGVAPSGPAGTITISHSCAASGQPTSPVRYDFTWNTYPNATSYEFQASFSNTRNADGSLQNLVIDQTVGTPAISLSGTGGTVFAVVRPNNFTSFFPLPPASAYSATCGALSPSPSPPSPSPSTPLSPSPSVPVSPSPSVPVSASPTTSPTTPPTTSPTVNPSPTEPPVPQGFTRIYYTIESGGALWGGSVDNLVDGGPALFIDIPSDVSGASTEAECLGTVNAQVANCPDAAFGTVKDSSGTPVEDVLVTVTLTEGSQTSAPITAITNQNGKYAVDLGNATSTDFKSFFRYNRGQNTGITVRADAADGRTNSISSATATDKPLPDIVLGTQTATPTTSPTAPPTGSPTTPPTGSPTLSPTTSPTSPPTGSPTTSPTVAPTTGPNLVAKLSLSPGSIGLGMGGVFRMTINLDTGGRPTSGTRAVLLYDKAIVFPLRIVPGTIYQGYPDNAQRILGDQGRVEISGINNSGSFTGTGAFAYVDFIAAAPGSTSINFDFTPGSTTDSNVADSQTNTDILGQATGANVNVSPQASVSPLPTATPQGRRLTVVATMEGKDPATQVGLANLTDNTDGGTTLLSFRFSNKVTIPIPNAQVGKPHSYTLKGYQHLAVTKEVVIQPDETVIDFGVLTTGDVAPIFSAVRTTQDDLIEVLDYADVKQSLNAGNDRVDLNGNGTVDVVDLSLVKKNLEQKGDILKSKGGAR